MPKKTIKTRRWTRADIPQIILCHKAAYPDYPAESHFGERIHEFQLAAFLEGQFLAELDGNVVGYATSIIVQLEDDDQWYTWTEITGAGTFSTHEPSGDTLYGSDIAVHPDYRGRGIAGLLYRERKRLLKRYNLRRMIAHGRLPGYSKYAGDMTAEEYVEKVQSGEIKDSALNAHLKAGYRVTRVVLDYMTDQSSLNYSTLLEMPNPDYRPERRRIAAMPLKRPVRKVRVCAAQYLMRRIQDWDEFERTVEFFVDTADSYNCHFLLFPELFTAQLFSIMPSELDDRAAIVALASMADRYRELFRRYATERQLYIVGGSHPIKRGDQVYNVAHLFTPGGQIYEQDKLHITRSEREVWGIQPGKGLKVFHTPLGRIAILICYDIEFPELSSIARDPGRGSTLRSLQHRREEILLPRALLRSGARRRELHVRRARRKRGNSPRGETLSPQLRPGRRLHPQRFRLPSRSQARRGRPQHRDGGDYRDRPREPGPASGARKCPSVARPTGRHVRARLQGSHRRHPNGVME